MYIQTDTSGKVWKMCTWFFRIFTQMFCIIEVVNGMRNKMLWHVYKSIHCHSLDLVYTHNKFKRLSFTHFYLFKLYSAVWITFLWKILFRVILVCFLETKRNEKQNIVPILIWSIRAPLAWYLNIYILLLCSTVQVY